MNSIEILQALKDGKINACHAKQRIERLKADHSVDSNKAAKSERSRKAIAIIGMSGRYPGARTVSHFWENLEQGKDCVTEIPKSRWDADRYYHPDPKQPDKIYCKWLGAVDDVDKFDPLFFAISPGEAEGIDPQHRLFMEEGYKAFEDAGYSAEQLAKQQCGIYLGIMNNEYSMMLYDAQMPSTTTGNSFSIAAARLAYFLNLKGPAISIDTACSSSLVATHMACTALNNGEIDMALAGGVTLYLTAGTYFGMCAAGMLSPEGRCKAFDRDADGFVPGEGVAGLVLKRLEDAEKAHDHIYGLIIASGTNQDGKTNGITAPSVQSQIDLERSVYKRFHIDPESISYLEAHGTGTKLGDPIELEALNTVFRERTDKIGFCAIGSVKSNLGHTSAASGLISIQKVLLSMKHKKIPPSLHFKHPNEHLELDHSPFYVNTELRNWSSDSTQPLRAAVSSFGYSGTNAHLVLEEYRGDRLVDRHNASHPHLFVFSGKCETQTRELLDAMGNFIKSGKSVQLEDMAFTLQTGRTALQYRVAILSASAEELLERIEAFLAWRDGSNALPKNIWCGSVGKKRKKPGALEKAAMKNRNLAVIAKLWIEGVGIDWMTWYKDRQPFRMSLPCYPFARERYWVKEKNRRIPVMLHKSWEAIPPTGTGPSRIDRDVIIVADQRTLDLARHLANHFPRHHLINISGKDVQRDIDCRYIGGWIDLSGYSEDRHDPLDPWLPLLQKVVEFSEIEHRFLLCVSKGLESYKNRNISLSGASRVGLYRMLQSEYSAVRSLHLDLDDQVGIEQAVQQILSECTAPHEDMEICYRAGRRYRAKLTDVPSFPAAKSSFTLFPDEHVLWVTGGTRGLGLATAKHLVRSRGVQRLVLTGRNPSFSKELLEEVRTLEGWGVRCKLASLELSNADRVQKFVDDVQNTLGPIGGLIHSAGCIDAKHPAFIRKSTDSMNTVLEPKIAGLDVLMDVIQGQPLQWVILFSSVSAILPALASGNSDYAMANAYMDYKAEALRAFIPVISIQWPSWKESGMGEAKTPAYKSTGLYSHTDQEGMELLDRILEDLLNTPQLPPVILPAYVDPRIWAPDRLLTSPGSRRSKKKADRQPPPVVRIESNGDNPLLTDTIEWMTDLFSREMKIGRERLDVNVEVQDYGVDSIIIAQLMRPIADMIDQDLDPSILFEFSTIASFSEWLVENHPSILRNKLKSKTASLVTALTAKTGGSPDEGATGPPPTMENRQNRNQDIAVVGMACRFPGADTLHAFWSNLSKGVSSISPIAMQERNDENVYYAGLINQRAPFASDFFLIPTEDAVAMDAQATLLLEECVHLFHHAGYALDEVKGQPIGVYIGGRSYNLLSEQDLLKTRNPVMVTGQNYLATNLSQFFDFRGPGVVLDTACSSALTAMSMAVQSIRNKEITAAVVGGVSLLQTHAAFKLFKQRHLLSDQPSFHIFDRRANGTVLGEGAGLVLLKTVDQARKDGDRIYSLIKGLAVNNDGRTAGPASPNFKAQKKVLETALIQSGKEPDRISYIDVNGSGSEVTDLLELKAIQSVYRNSSTVPCNLGSIKPNIGHPLCAEGIASFIKVSLMLHHRQWVPFLSAIEPMTHYDLKASPFYFSREIAEWRDVPRVAAINCFADGGTNAHVILEAWENEEPDSCQRQPLPRSTFRGEHEVRTTTHPVISSWKRSEV